REDLTILPRPIDGSGPRKMLPERPGRSELGQNAKYSVRADVFRFASKLGHCSMRSALRICARFGFFQLAIVEALGWNQPRGRDRVRRTLPRGVRGLGRTGPAVSSA